jgi:thiamine monophosphate synthase
MTFLRSRLRLSLLVDVSHLEVANDPDRLTQWADAGVTSLFLRPVHTASLEIKEALHGWKAKGGYAFAVEDPVMAVRLGCDGVYLREPTVKRICRARELLGPERFLGIEIKAEEQWQDLKSSESTAAPDFVGIGPVFQYGQKTTLPLGVEKARRLSAAVKDLPHFWLGGVQKENLEDFEEDFAHGVLVDRALNSKNIVDEAFQFQKRLAHLLGLTFHTAFAMPADHNFRFSRKC